MFGEVYFIDGHSESITSYHCNPTHSELYFTTESGQYGFKKQIESQTYDVALHVQPILVKQHAFYKYSDYYGRWIAEPSIEIIRIYMEVLPNG